MAALFAMAGTTIAAPVDLSGWTAQGGSSNWQVAVDHNSVLQTLNGNPTVFFSGTNDQGKALSGKIKVETTSDDDYIGFVLGYKSGDASASSTDFILIDWKQSTQPYYGCVAPAGLAISRISGGLPDSADLWCHTGTVSELARAANLGSTGWADSTEYSFDLVFTATNIQVKVDGTTELNINGSFADGSFGFYNYSQAQVRYFALTEDQVPDPDPDPNPAPAPASLALVGLGLIAAAATRRRRSR